MTSVTELRQGIVFDDPNTGVGPWLVLKYDHIKVGRGSATIKVKIKNIKTGTIIEKGYQNGAKVQDVTLERKKGQFLYKDESGYVFMEPETYEQFTVSEELVSENGRFLKDGTMVDVRFYNDDPISIALPQKMQFKVVETEPGFKGNTVGNTFKDAIIDSGAHVKIPMFIEQGELIVINTETGEYAERIK